MTSSIDPRTPVLVGAGTVTSRGDDPTALPDAIDLMIEAVGRAAADSGAPRITARTDVVMVPEGTWLDPDPGRAVADAVGAPGATTVMAMVGVLQQTLLTRAAEAIAAGDADVVVVVGAEARGRDTLARRAGITLPERSPLGDREAAGPTVALRPARDILPAVEIERQLAVPAHQYAMVESVIAADAGRSPTEQRRVAAELWARFAAVAADRDDAWDRSRPDADAIATPTATNREIAFPYTRWMCSQWNVDQAGAVVLCSVAAARRAQVSTDRWVFPVAAATSDHMTAFSERAVLGSWPAAAAVMRGLDELSPRPVAEAEVVDLYSCFPAAVQVQAAAAGLPLDRPLTVTGGMTFGGGPLNNYVLQSLPAVVEALRADPGSLGVVTSVSGMLTKSGGSTWSATPPADGFRAVDVTAAAEATTPVLEVDPDATGAGTVAAVTVVAGRDAPDLTVALVDVGSVRTVAVGDDADAATAVRGDGAVGRAVHVPTPGRLAW